MMYSGEMVWFVGVVEDRRDPLEMGRVKVRCFGIHDAPREELPTNSLPWASLMLPANSAGTGSIGQSATGIVEGAWVVGFFTDGKNMQEPLVMGVLPSNTSNIDPKDPFSDPHGVNPVYNTGTDQPLHARADTYQEDPSYKVRNTQRVTGVETATPPRVNSLIDDKNDDYYSRGAWDYPEVHGGSSPEYPSNKVTQSESGHVLEIDDTPGGTRIAQFHRSGTNYEMLHNGDMATTVVGDNYEVTFKNNNMYVKGNLNITVNGDMKTLVKGNYHLEVEGDKTEKINRGSRHSKIRNSDFTEIGKDFGSNVKVDYIQRVGGIETRIVDSDRKTTIGGNETLTINRDSTKIIQGNHDEIVAKAHSSTALGTMTTISLKDMKIETAANQITNIDGYHDLNVEGVSRMDAQFMFLNDQDATSSHPGATGDGAAARVGDTADTGDAGGGSHFDSNAAGTDDIISGSSTVYIGG